MEVGTVLAVASGEGPAALPDQPVGELIRVAVEDDERLATSVAESLASAFDAARQLAHALELPLDIIDSEVIPEPRTLILHYLGLSDFDPRPLVSSLSRRFDVTIELLDLTPPFAKHVANEEAGNEICSACGRPDGGCGEGGGCTSCGSGGGCGSHCSAAGAETFHQDWQAYFAELRSKMEKRFPIATV
jgi:hypothetical protein